MTYNTGNNLGSTDPRDLSDNSENLDRAVNNAASATWTDRFGKSRTSLAGQIGYIGTGTNGAIENYASGQVLSTYNTIIRYNSEFYRPSASATLPYTTTATLPDVDGNLVAIGDANLRQDLASNVTGSGSDDVAHTGTTDTVTEALDKRTIYVGSVAEGISGIEGINGASYIVNQWQNWENKGGHSLVYRASASKNEHGRLGWSPTVPAVSSQTGITLDERTENYLNGVGETDPGGTGLFVITDEILSIYTFGAIDDGAIDVPITKLLLSPTTIALFPHKKQFTLSSFLDFGVVPPIFGNGSTIICEGGGGIRFDANRQTATATVATAAIKFDMSLTLSDASEYNVGDTIVIMNDADFSFGGSRASYRDGDIQTIVRKSGNELFFREHLELDVATTGFSLQKMNNVKLDIQELNLIYGPTSTATILQLDGCTGRIIGCDISGLAGNHAISAAVLYDFEFTRVSAVNLENGTAFGYATALRGGKNVTVNDCRMYSRRHAITTGSGASPANPPTRHFRLNNSVFTSFGEVSNTHAADSHGHCEDVIYRDCVAYGGVVLGGKDNHWLGGEIYSNTSQGGMYLREVISGVFTFKPNTYYHNAPDEAVGNHSSSEMNSAYGDIEVVIDTKMRNSAAASNFASISWGTTEDHGVSIDVQRLEMDVWPTLDFVRFTNQVGSGHVRRIRIGSVPIAPSATTRWFDLLGTFLKPGVTRVSLPKISFPLSLSVPATGSASTGSILLGDNNIPRLPLKNVTIEFEPHTQGTNGLVVGSIRATGVDGNGYVSFLTGQVAEVTGAFSATTAVEGTVTVSANDVEPIAP